MAKLLPVVLGFVLVVYLQTPTRVHARPPEEDLQEEDKDSEEQKKQLLDVLHNVLDKLQKKRLSLLERRYRRLPGCNVGDFCSVKRGARHGQLCDCPRGSRCNYFFLKCL